MFNYSSFIIKLVSLVKVVTKKNAPISIILFFLQNYIEKIQKI